MGGHSPKQFPFKLLKVVEKNKANFFSCEMINQQIIMFFFLLKQNLCDITNSRFFQPKSQILMLFLILTQTIILQIAL